MKIILGSQSKNRQKILREAGYSFEVMPSNIDEKAVRVDDPKELVLTLARAKAEALLPKIREATLLITSDLVTMWKGELREKPKDEKEARKFLQTLHEAPSQALACIKVTNTQSKKTAEGFDTAKIYFREIPKDVIDMYIATEEPYEKAGGWSPDSLLIKPYIEKIEGSLDSIMGMPIQLTKRLIKEVAS